MATAGFLHHSRVALALCVESSLCWEINHMPKCGWLADGSRVPARRSLYPAALMLPSIFRLLPGLEAQKRPNRAMLHGGDGACFWCCVASDLHHIFCIMARILRFVRITPQDLLLPEFRVSPTCLLLWCHMRFFSTVIFALTLPPKLQLAKRSGNSCHMHSLSHLSCGSP